MSTIQEILSQFNDAANAKLNEEQIRSALNNLKPNHTGQDLEHLDMEIMAFGFDEDQHDSPWNTYFGPLVTYGNNDGTVFEWPSIKSVDLNTITYWEKRADEVLNPFLKARYLGVVWEFKKKVIGVDPNHDICRQYIDALLEVANRDLSLYEYDGSVKAKRALALAVSLNDKILKEKCKTCIIAFEERHAIDDKPGLWGYSFDLLLGNRKIELTPSEEKKIIADLEAKLCRLSEGTDDRKIDPWSAEQAAERLATYYRRKNKTEDMKRVIMIVGEAYSKIESSGSAMQVSGWLEDLRQLYIRYNLNDQAHEVLLKIRELGPKVASEMGTISHQFQISKEKRDYIVAAMTSGSKEEILNKIIAQYIPDLDETQQRVFELSKKAPIAYLMSTQLHDDQGRMIARIGSLKDDLDGHVVRQLSEDLYITAISLRLVLNGAIQEKGLIAPDILQFIRRSPVIDSDRIEIIEAAINAYFRRDFLVFIHLVIPQIEEGIRNIVEYAGGNVLKPQRDGSGFHLRTFDDLLRDSIIKQALGDDLTNYFRVVFTDQRGWNLRNKVCHGLADPNVFSQQTADRVLHTLLCLGTLRKKTE